jgi:hypothetical protein
MQYNLGGKIKMKRNIERYLIIFSILIIPTIGFCETPEEYRVKDTDLNIETASANLSGIEAALKDFRGFTEMVLADGVVDELKDDKAVANIKIKRGDLKRFSTLDWSTQNIGFNNWILKLRGTLLKSAYLTKKYEYELSKCRKDVSKIKLSNLEKVMNDALAQYRTFLSRATLVD